MKENKKNTSPATDNNGIKFIQFRKKAFLLSLIFFALSIFIIAFTKINWGIDFTGGTVAQIKFDKQINIEDLRESMKSYNPTIQEFPKSFSYILKFSQSEETQNLSEEVNKKLTADFHTSSPEIMRFEMVGPVVGKFLIKAALYAFCGAIFGIILYVGLRFRGGIWGLAAVAALIHDVAITFGILCFMKISIDLIIITALLFIAGYSVNDTIVIYDRIRENLRRAERKNISDIFNSSITQTLSRTLITSLTTELAIIPLFIFGGETIHSFSLALLLGVLIGTYSSIFIASPLVYIVIRKH